MIFMETELFPPLGVVALLIILVFRFPRAVGFPLFIISGIVAVTIGFICLSFPVIDNSGHVLLNREGNGLIHIQPVPHGNSGTSSVKMESAHSVSFEAAGEDSVMEFRAQCFAFSKIVPLVGAVDRGLIAEILGDNKLLFAEPRTAWKKIVNFFSKTGSNEKTLNVKKTFLSLWDIRKNLELTELPAGTGLTVFFDGSALMFR